MALRLRNEPHGFSFHRYSSRETGSIVNSTRKSSLLKWFGLAAVAISTLSLATPAQAADVTWYSSSSTCHNVTRSESGASLSQSRRGMQGSGGNGAGATQLTVTFGSVSSTQWSGTVTMWDSVRSYKAGKFKVVWPGAQAGECARNYPSYGRALDVGRPSMVPPSAVEAEAELDEWGLAASKNAKPDYVTVTAQHGTLTIETEFTREQVADGDAQILVNDAADGSSELITYDPSNVSEFSITESTTLPNPHVE